MKKVLVVILGLFLGIELGYSQTIVYYDPDGNLRRIVDINAEGNKLFGSIGMKFIVAADENSFSNAVRQYNPEYFILNSLIYQSKKKDLNLEIAFVFGKDGRFTYTKKVVTFQEGLSIRDLANRILASSFRDVSELIPVEARILKVPKDLDALLAMKFKQADAAVVSESSIEIFRSISPVDSGLLRVIYTSREIFNPVFCYAIGKGTISKAKEVEKLLLSANAKQFLSLLMFDGVSSESKVLSRIR